MTQFEQDLCEITGLSRDVVYRALHKLGVSGVAILCRSYGFAGAFFSEAYVHLHSGLTIALVRTSEQFKQAKKLPTELYKSLTWDRGKELSDHRRFSLATDIDVYFCDPRSPWQRGSNENTNGLLRQYFAKGTDLSVYSQAHLNKVARQLNERPRKTLEFETPAERFNVCVALTD